jgi:hypothetical protein
MIVPVMAALVVLISLGVTALVQRETPSDATSEVPSPEPLEKTEPPLPEAVDPPQEPSTALADVPDPPTPPPDQPPPSEPPTDGRSSGVEKPSRDEVPAVAGLPDVEPDASPSADSALCRRKRKQAQQARDGHDWDGMLRHTRSTDCWTEQREERRKLRAKAFMELEQWDECVAASRGLDDDEGRKWYKICLRRKEGG